MPCWKPAERFEIEVVGRFIQHQDVWLHHEESCQMGAHDPAATQGACRLGNIPFPEGKSAENALCFDFEGVAFQFGETGKGFVMDGIFLFGMFPE